MEQIIFGRNTVSETVKNSKRKVNAVFIAKESLSDLYAVQKEAGSKNIQVKIVSRKDIERMCKGENHQGIAMSVEPVQYVDLKYILKTAERKNEKPFIVVLDSVQDPHNLGAVLRTAECAGVHGVVIPKHDSVEITPAVEKVSSGAAEYIPVAKVNNLNQALITLKENSVWVVGIEKDGSEPYHKMDFLIPIAIVLGGEGGGIRKSVKEKCDFLAHIPMKGNVTSLNVSVSAAIAMYEAVRQRSRIL